MTNSQQKKIQNGKIGEVLVELELLKRGWHVERLDGASKAVNGDLISIKGRRRVVIQVKSALSWQRPNFGHAGPFLTNKKKSLFNSGNATIFADVLVTVCGKEEQHFHVFKVEDAEEIGKKKAKEWFKTPKKDGAKRSPNFPISFSLTDPEIEPHADAWDILEKLNP